MKTRLLIIIGIAFSLTFSQAFSETTHTFEYSKIGCDMLAIDQIQSVLEEKKWIKTTLDECVERGLITSELVELGATVWGHSTRELSIAYGLTHGDIEKTIQLLQDPNYPINVFGSPYKQVSIGIEPENVLCKEGLLLVQKYDGLPACVKPATFEKLYLRGWGDCPWNCSHPVPDDVIKPEPTPDSESLQRQKQQQAKIHTQEIIIADTRGHENKINAIKEYRDEFESEYFLEQFIYSNKQNYEKDKLMNFIFGEWGYQPKNYTSSKVEVYFRSYDNYDKIEKINEWQKPKDFGVFLLTSDSDGYLMMDLHGMPPATGIHETCTIPGEYRVAASNLEDGSKKEYGYFTCQKEKLVGNPQPWMELPE